MIDVREILKKRPLLFDGGMGTYYKAKPGQECELANLTDPAGVLAVHREYLAAGADAVKTNTFGLPRMAAAQTPEWEAAVQAGAKKDLWYWNSILKTWNAKGLRTVHDVRGPVPQAGASRNSRVDRAAPSGNDILKNATRRRSLIKKPE